MALRSRMWPSKGPANVVREIGGVVGTPICGAKWSVRRSGTQLRWTTDGGVQSPRVGREETVRASQVKAAPSNVGSARQDAGDRADTPDTPGTVNDPDLACSHPYWTGSWSTWR